MPKGPLKIPPLDLIKGDTPLSLPVAAAVAFPDGTMTTIGLRTEHRAGRLEMEQIAGKLYVTLDAIKAMRALCSYRNTEIDRPGVNPGSPGALEALKAAAAKIREDARLARRARRDEEREADRLERLRILADRQKEP